MIRVERPHAGPAVLDKLYGSTVKPPKLAHRSEKETVLLRIQEHRDAVEAARAANERPPKFSFPFERYSEREVIEQLRQLFHGKCAYCESRYAGTQPMDVEHWRPKGEVHVTKTEKITPGYYWLASEWSNLLPSCIDCNRGREQFDAFENTNVVLGKKNQFPLLDETTRVSNHADDPDNVGFGEAIGLINPSLDDPEEFFHYDEQGIMHPKSADENSDSWKRAMHSIRVYALNRGDLVAERRALIRRIDHRLQLIERLDDIREHLAASHLPAIVDLVGDLIAEEIDALLAMKAPEEPYAGLARQIIGDAEASLPE